GTLTLTGGSTPGPVSAGQVISLADAGFLVFTPAANANGMGYASFTYQVIDNGGTANGGVNEDPTPNTVTINVTPVNDAPNGTNNTVTTLEDVSYTFDPADFGFADALDGPDNFFSIIIDTMPTNGTLTYNGGSISTPLEILY